MVILVIGFQEFGDGGFFPAESEREFGDGDGFSAVIMIECGGGD
ncbi:hypothetical protein Tco_0677298, partial [Tanacetum coccineum]